MKKLIFKSSLYLFLLLITLEVLVRVFYLGKDNPTRLLDEHKVEKWKPNQHGYSVTGNRKQNFSEFNINSSGFNSYREFNPKHGKIEVALVGDSFIEGFHQHYYNSIGKKIEKFIPEIEIYEYGYAGYDFADQLHLIHSYQKDFDLIDHVILGIKFSNDLERDTYEVVTSRLALESPLNKTLKKSKLLVYCSSIGVLDPPQIFIRKAINLFRPKQKKELVNNHITPKDKEELERKYLANFEHLVTKYGYDKKRFTLLLDTRITPTLFLSYLKENEYSYIDFSSSFTSSDQPTTLIYDRHWNNHGRELIANVISEHIQKKRLISQQFICDF
ncbi:hypothetical protein [Aquimarina pacifica]|uniref:hypothetical protein n=1 Tax=Aquimarina pacifica TaxID=1296415 RepID=UPI0004719162|nr:hypothetical protein [Aquimarina pacifica]